MANITVYPGHREFVQGAAALVAELAAAAVEKEGRFTIALAGGGTPRPVYEMLARPVNAARIPWEHVHVFFGDERCVPPENPDSNYGMACKALLDHVPLPRANIYRIAGENDPASAALDYEQELRNFFRTETPPPLDLILLGIGDNGHTASLFPGTASLHEQQRWVVPQFVEVMGAWRVTFTPGLINAARNVVFLVEGAGKAEVLDRILTGPYQPDVLPAQLIQPDSGPARWLIDAAAHRASG